jgi:hypothetical protein
MSLKTTKDIDAVLEALLQGLLDGSMDRKNVVAANGIISNRLKSIQTELVANKMQMENGYVNRSVEPVHLVTENIPGANTVTYTRKIRKKKQQVIIDSRGI